MKTYCSRGYNHQGYQCADPRSQRLQSAISASYYIHPLGLTDDSPAKRHVPAEMHVTRNSQVIQLDNLGNLLEPFLELLDLLEVVAELDHRRGLEHAALVENELSVL